MAVNVLRIGSLEYTDRQICHTMVHYGDSTVCVSRIGDRHLRYPVKLQSQGPASGERCGPLPAAAPPGPRADISCMVGGGVRRNNSYFTRRARM